MVLFPPHPPWHCFISFNFCIFFDVFTVWGPLTCHVKSRLWCIFQKSDRWSSSFFDVDFHQQRRKKKCSDWEGSCMCGLVAALYQLMHTTGSDTCCIPFQKITTAVGAPCWCPKEPGVTSVCVHTPDCLHCRCKHVSLTVVIWALIGVCTACVSVFIGSPSMEISHSYSGQWFSNDGLWRKIGLWG